MPPRTTELARSAFTRRAAPTLSTCRSTVAPMSARRKAAAKLLADVVAVKRATVRNCQAQPMLRAALMHPRNSAADTARYVAALQSCTPWRPDEAHHLLSRARGNGDTLVDPANIILACSGCHRWITEDRDGLATRAGLLIPSSAVRRVFGRIA